MTQGFGDETPSELVIVPLPEWARKEVLSPKEILSPQALLEADMNVSLDSLFSSRATEEWDDRRVIRRLAEHLLAQGWRKG